MYDDYRAQGFVALAINLWQDMNSVVKPKARLYTYQFLREGSDKAVWNTYKIGGYIPLNYVIDTAGIVVYGAEGFDEAVVRAEIEGNLPPTGVSENKAEPLVRILSVSPNPANRPAAIQFSLRKPADVSLRVYASSGKLIRTVYNGARNSGVANLSWNLLDDNHARVADGMYFFELAAGSTCARTKVTVLK